MESVIWLIALAIFIIIEIATLGLTTVWFAFGAAAAFVVCIAGGGIPLQLLLFIIASLASLFAVRPYVARKFTSERIKTNYSSLIGMEAKVTEKIDNFNQTGTAVINGLEWTARAENDKSIIEAGAKVNIMDVQGVKLIVKKKEDE